MKRPSPEKRRIFGVRINRRATFLAIGCSYLLFATFALFCTFGDHVGHGGSHHSWRPTPPCVCPHNTGSLSLISSHPDSFFFIEEFPRSLEGPNLSLSSLVGDSQYTRAPPGFLS